MSPRLNTRILRDVKARQGVKDNEISLRAYLYVARNQCLPAQARYQAQLQLNAFGRYTRPTTVKNRYTTTGRSRSVKGESSLCQVSGYVFFSMFPALTGTCGVTVPISFEGSCGRVARRSQSLLVEGIVRIGS